MPHLTPRQWFVLFIPLGYILLAAAFVGTIWVGATYSKCQARAVEQTDTEYAATYAPHSPDDMITYLRLADERIVNARNDLISERTKACFLDQTYRLLAVTGNTKPTANAS